MFKRRIFTNEDKMYIVEEYNKGKTIGNLSKELKCRTSSISNILKEFNVERHSIKNKGKVLTLEEEKNVCELYLTKKYTQKILAEKFSCSTYVIHNALIRNNIDIEKNKPQHISDTKLKEDYFEKIDTEYKAYFLGLLFADGNVFKKQITLELNFKDIEILQKLKEELNCSNKISYRKRTNTEMSSIRIISEKMCEDLSKYNIVPNKTYVSKHLPKVPEEYKKDFLRGLIDGDGWITFSKNGQPHVGFVNYNYNICKEFQEQCNSLITAKNKSKITTKGKNTHHYVCQFQSKEQTKQLMTVLYKDSKICLTRKYLLAERVWS